MQRALSKIQVTELHKEELEKAEGRLNMDSFKSDLTQTQGPSNTKRYRSSSSEIDDEAQPSSFVKLLEDAGVPIINTDHESLLKNTKKCIGRFFYENGLDLDAINSPTFQRMMSVFSGQTMIYQLPTREELEGWILEDAMKEMRDYVCEIRNSWGGSGCSILLDGWTDSNGRNLVNILVDCPKGTIYLRSSDITDCAGNVDSMLDFFKNVIMEVGISNIVQIVSNWSSAVMKEVGRVLMETYRSMFWTVSASFCIELMLEKLEGMEAVKDTLNKAKSIITFIHSHPSALKFFQDQSRASDLVHSSKIKSIQPLLTLENIVLEKETLVKMFLSNSSSLVLTRTNEGQQVADLVADKSFWMRASSVLKGVIPLVRAIVWLHRGNKDHVGYIYETIDQVKETIKQGLKNKKSEYSPYWKAIDEVWNELLHSPLHSAGYYLNQTFFYSTDVYIDPEVVTGLICCVVRSSVDPHVQDQVTIQLEKYRARHGPFSIGCAPDERSKLSPACWWMKYGVECPELQRLAVRYLSQTCEGAPKFGLNRGLAETLLPGVRPQRMLHLLYLRYNMHLRNFVHGKSD